MKPKSLPYLIIGLIITLCCNYVKAQDPTLQISKNPITCGGSEGALTFSNLTPNATYLFTYTDDGVTRGPITLVTDAAGQVTISNLNAGSYSDFIFNLNGTIKTLNIAIPLQNPIIPTKFNNLPPSSLCQGDLAPALPASSNGIPGSWSPGVINNQNSGIYTFNPAAGSCGTPVTISVTVIPKEEARFSFGKNITICGIGPIPTLPNTSMNGITGFWSPAVVSPTNSGTYVFTATSTGCVTGTTLTVTIDPTITPSFTFNSSNSICDGGTVPTLPSKSTNNITGVWSPAVVSNTTSGTYVFTPDPGQCATPFVYTQTVNPIIPPTFSFGNTISICANDVAPVLPATSTNGTTGTWDPATVSNTKTGTYTFKSTSDPCAPPFTVTVTVNPLVTPQFPFGTSQSVCINIPAPVLTTKSTNNITGTWSPAIVDNQATGTYTFTPDPGQCAVPTSLKYEVNPKPSVINVRGDTSIVDGDIMTTYNFPVDIPVTGINWTNTNPTIGLPANGSGTVPSFTATNMNDTAVYAIITATPYVNGCLGVSQSYRIKVIPRNKDIFVPNVFSPNNDGHNDQLYVYGNYINTFELHIYNQWGQRMIVITDKKQGWDGKFKGSPQPVGVYAYVLKAVMTDGRTVNKKGSITIVR
ncbi:gliding motility-associated C-terminal domain-containing protein [Niastella sp. OAS944]|uniref:T9SS type B sorting domain-containing protein n=1 Tax=Niastella sp. OAS944 TaxID=2664089 RepID=UPI00347C65A1|nr:gliding motility-associated-like protein [Chitinophagaceae bacterium OAS944]